MRAAIETNDWVRLVFPNLKKGEPWNADRFTVQRPAEAIGPSVGDPIGRLSYSLSAVSDNPDHADPLAVSLNGLPPGVPYIIGNEGAERGPAA